MSKDISEDRKIRHLSKLDSVCAFSRFRRKPIFIFSQLLEWWLRKTTVVLFF